MVSSKGSSMTELEMFRMLQSTGKKHLEWKVKMKEVLRIELRS